jgi:carbon starvation protein
LIQGVRDPLGGINSLWPLFGIANQMLAAIALCLATTIILKMQLQRRAGVPPASNLESETQGAKAKSETGGTPVLHSPALVLITSIPLVWLVAVTFTAGIQKIFHPDPRIGFLAQAHLLKAKIEECRLMEQTIVRPELVAEFTKKLQAAETDLPQNRSLYFNNVLDAAVAGIFLALVTAIILLSVREWVLLLTQRKPAVLHETEPVWLPDYALKETGPNFSTAAGAAALALALAKEWSGESHLERAHQQAQTVCRCHAVSAQRIYVEVTEQRFNGVKRCC